jgi:predicted RNA binding protein YcfA (HicA-like mRNA interferase family)
VADYYRDLVRLLREDGYEFKRQGPGDHEIWWSPKTGVYVTVDRKVALHRNGILNEAGIAKAF